MRDSSLNTDLEYAEKYISRWLAHFVGLYLLSMSYYEITYTQRPIEATSSLLVASLTCFYYGFFSRKHKKIMPLNIFTLSICGGHLIYRTFMVGGFSIPNFAWFPILTIASAIFVNRKFAKIITTICLLSFAGVYYCYENIEYFQQFLIEIPSTRMFIVSSVSLIVSYQMVSFLGDNYKKSQQMLKEQVANQAHSSKLISLGEMAGGIAHEINNPLQIIKGRSYQIKKNIKNQNFEKAIENAEKLEEKIETIIHMINSMKNMARASDNDDHTYHPINEVFEDTLYLANSKITSNAINFIQEIENEEAIVKVNKGEISQVLTNLMNNAIDAVSESENPEIILKTKHHNNKIVISVIDNGEGIKDAVKDKLFQPFFTTKPVGKGTGIGLSISKTIIQNHEGDLNIENDPEFKERTCFNIILPVYTFEEVILKKVAS